MEYFRECIRKCLGLEFINKYTASELQSYIDVWLYIIQNYVAQLLI